MNRYYITFNVRLPYTYPCYTTIIASSEEEAKRKFEEACKKADGVLDALPFDGIDGPDIDVGREGVVAHDCGIEVEDDGPVEEEPNA